MTVGSDIDATQPPDNVRAEKSAMRANWAAAKDEIEALQRDTSLAVRIAFGVSSMTEI